VSEKRLLGVLGIKEGANSAAVRGSKRFCSSFVKKSLPLAHLFVTTFLDATWFLFNPCISLDLFLLLHFYSFLSSPRPLFGGHPDVVVLRFS